MPITQYDPASRGAVAYHELTKELISRGAAANHHEVTKELIAR
jgi:hypothetical protein